MKIWVVAALLLIGTHSAIYYYGSKKPAETIVVEKTVVKRDVQTVIKEVVRPDGTKETTTVVTDKTKESSAASTTIKQMQKDWLLGAYYRINDPTYALNLQRRIIGPVFLGAHVDLKGDIYVGASIEF